MTIITAARAEHNKNTDAIVPTQANMNYATSQKETIVIAQRVSGGIFFASTHWGCRESPPDQLCESEC